MRKWAEIKVRLSNSAYATLLEQENRYKSEFKESLHKILPVPPYPIIRGGSCAYTLLVHSNYNVVSEIWASTLIKALRNFSLCTLPPLYSRLHCPLKKKNNSLGINEIHLALNISLTVSVHRICSLTLLVPLTTLLHTHAFFY